MSQKSRKKSSKSSFRRSAGAKPPAQAKAKRGKTRSLSERKSVKKQVSRSSHKAARKPLTAKTAAVAKPELSAGKSPQLIEGAKAPAFRLPRDGGGMVSLSDFAGQKLVLFIYPRANTPGCTREAIDFTRLSDAFAHSGTAVLGISADPPKAQQAFRDKHELSVPLLSDERHEMLEAYGAWGEKSLYGRTFFGIIRTTVLIGADGRINRIWRHVKVDGHADQVLAAAMAAA
jgi:thioredoxin-dependent peroxiredoxin